MWLEANIGGLWAAAIVQGVWVPSLVPPPLQGFPWPLHSTVLGTYMTGTVWTRDAKWRLHPGVSMAWANARRQERGWQSGSKGSLKMRLKRSALGETREVRQKKIKFALWSKENSPCQEHLSETPQPPCDQWSRKIIEVQEGGEVVSTERRSHEQRRDSFPFCFES